MQRIRVICWKAEEAGALVDALSRAGFRVEFDSLSGAEIFRALRAAPADAVVIDLSRLPSHGREMAVALRGHKATRAIPILFVGGDPARIEPVRRLLPDAWYCEPGEVAAALRKCVRNAPESPVVPAQMMERYAGRTTAQKLGIAAGTRVAVVDAPRDYGRVIGAVPDGVEFDEESWKGCAVTVWFIEEPETLLAALGKMKRAAAATKLWVAWPKKSAGKDSLVNERMIREAALSCGLVDYKICSISDKWSGLCFAVKK